MYKVAKGSQRLTGTELLFSTAVQSPLSLTLSLTVETVQNTDTKRCWCAEHDQQQLAVDGCYLGDIPLGKV